jgi:hypothetical protein
MLKQNRGSFFLGFDAAFVGDPDGIGALEVGLFFPLGPNGPETRMDGCGDRQFKGVIPFVEPGKLEDDVQGSAPQLPGSFRDRDSFFVIEGGGPDQPVTFRRNDDGSLFEQKVGDDPVLRLISTRVYLGSGPSPSGAKREEGKVPWRDFLFACLRAMDHWVPDDRYSPNTRWMSQMGDFLGDLNEAPLPSRYDRNLYVLAFYQRQIGVNTEFLTKIRAVHAELVEKFAQETVPQ